MGLQDRDYVKQKHQQQQQNHQRFTPNNQRKVFDINEGREKFALIMFWLSVICGVIAYLSNKSQALETIGYGIKELF